MVIKSQNKFKKKSPQYNSETDSQSKRWTEISKNIYITNWKKKIKKDNKLLMILDWYNNVIIEHQKFINLLDNTPNQPYKFRTKNWDKINVDLHGKFDTNCLIKFKTTMLKSS